MVFWPTYTVSTSTRWKPHYYRPTAPLLCSKANFQSKKDSCIVLLFLLLSCYKSTAPARFDLGCGSNHLTVFIFLQLVNKRLEQTQWQLCNVHFNIPHIIKTLMWLSYMGYINPTLLIFQLHQYKQGVLGLSREELLL